MKTELKEIKPGVYKLFKNDKATGKKYEHNDSGEFLYFNFKDKLFDIPCSALPDNTSLEFHFDEATIEGWTEIITLKRKKKELIISYFADINPSKPGYYNNLNEYVLMRKIADLAKKEGLKPDYIPESEPFYDIYMITDTEGTVRQKILRGTTLLSAIRKKAEREMVADIKKGILLSKMKSIPFKGYLKLL